jgi:hypothetical protein
MPGLRPRVLDLQRIDNAEIISTVGSRLRARARSSRCGNQRPTRRCSLRARSGLESAIEQPLDRGLVVSDGELEQRLARRRDDRRVVVLLADVEPHPARNPPNSVSFIRPPRRSR